MKLLPAARALACVAVAALLGPLDTEAQNLKWKFASNDWVESSSVLGPDGALYVGSNDNNIYAINATGGLKWKYATGGQVQSSPALGADGTVYVGSLNGSIYAINSGVGCNCPAGTFVSSPALLTSCSALASVCTPCPLGSFCPYLRSAAMFPSRCPAGCFCNATRMALPAPCPAGTFSPESGVKLLQNLRQGILLRPSRPSL